MTIILLLFLGVSVLCASTLIAACVVSGRNRNYAEDNEMYQDGSEQQTMTPAVTSLHTSSTRVTP